MNPHLARTLSLEVPLIVRLGQCKMALGEVLDLVPGAILELPKRADEDLELLVNNKAIGVGSAVKVGENFGLRIVYIGDMTDRIAAMGPSSRDQQAPEEDESVAAMAAKLLGGQ